MNETGHTQNGLKTWVREYVGGKIDRHKVEVHLNYTATGRRTLGSVSKVCL